MAASPLRVSWELHTPASVPETWALMSDTERFNRAVGFGFQLEKAQVRDLGDWMVSEAVPAPRPGATAEDDAWLLLTAYVPEEARTHLLVLDAADLSTVARARLPHAVPPGFHGSWVPTPA